MKLNDQVTLRGDLYIKKNGVLVREVHNLVVYTGQVWIAQRIGGSTSPAPKNMEYMAIGSGNLAPTVDDTQLGVELGRAKGDIPQVNGNQVMFSCSFAEGVGTGPITEAGIFDSGDALSGNMLSRSAFPLVNKEVNDYITILWIITVGNCA